MCMMKQQNKQDVYIRVHNIHWNEGPEEGYTGPESFWFVVDHDTYKRVKTDPINKLALFQEIENQLEDSGEYGGIVSDLLEFEFVLEEEFKDEDSIKRWGLKKGQNLQVTDLIRG